MLCSLLELVVVLELDKFGSPQLEAAAASSASVDAVAPPEQTLNQSMFTTKLRLEDEDEFDSSCVLVRRQACNFIMSALAKSGIDTTVQLPISA